MIAIATTTNAMNQKGIDPNMAATPEKLKSVGTVGHNQARAARADDHHGLGAWRVGRGQVGSPLRAAIVDARAAVGIPLPHMNALADVGRYLRRRRVLHPPAVRNEGVRKSEHQGHRPCLLYTSDA